ncbi:hypothetical protein JL09_g6923 [Pichia kudriavzevii]|nr:hypothetical protein JL09_g6923 [Pichia kudriavzevii]
MESILGGCKTLQVHVHDLVPLRETKWAIEKQNFALTEPGNQAGRLTCSA